MPWVELVSEPVTEQVAASTVMTMAMPGKVAIHQPMFRIDPSVGQASAPGDQWEASPRGREKRALFKNDHFPNVKGGKDNCAVEHVGNDVDKEDSPPAGAGYHRHFNELRLGEAHGLKTDDPACSPPIGDRNDDNDVREARADGPDDGDGDEYVREGEHYVGEPHDHRIKPPAEVSCNHAENVPMIRGEEDTAKPTMADILEP